MATRRYIIYADESDKRGAYYSNFFGGVLLQAPDRQAINDALYKKIHELGLRKEIKWQHVDQTCVDRYIEFIRLYFTFVETSRLKVRIMFTHNMKVPNNLERRHYADQYFILYYQFIKHAFGIAYCNPNSLDRVVFTIFPDKIPDSEAKLEQFKNYLCRIPQSRLFLGKNLQIPRSEIADVDSSDHPILQGLDLILGSMNARLNEKLKYIPEGARVRGNRTRAKEQLYKEINKLVRTIYPHFNIGITTGTPNGAADRWNRPYRHWCFTAKNHTIDRSFGKKRAKRKN